VDVIPTPNPNYLYSLDDGPLQDSNVFSPVSPGNHTIKVTDLNGCTDLEEDIFVIGYPHFFTPNGDGVNDTWNIIGLKDPNTKIYIYDRYGKLVKQISPTGTGWDGTYNGEVLPSTDYWFTIDYVENGGAKLFKAHFSMRR
jgi:valyl-tRNA synthetase